MATFLREQPQDYLAAYRLMRCVRWDTHHRQAPPHEAERQDAAGRPARGSCVPNLQRLLLQKQWPELLDRLDRAPLQKAPTILAGPPGYYAFYGAGSGGRRLRTRPRPAGHGLRANAGERLPGIEQLSFADGTPFADDTTLEWIARHATVRDVELGRRRGASVGLIRQHRLGGNRGPGGRSRRAAGTRTRRSRGCKDCPCPMASATASSANW